MNEVRGRERERERWQSSDITDKWWALSCHLKMGVLHGWVWGSGGGRWGRGKGARSCFDTIFRISACIWSVYLMWLLTMFAGRVELELTASGRRHVASTPHVVASTYSQIRHNYFWTFSFFTTPCTRKTDL